MLYFIKKYPISLIIISIIAYLSLFNPPDTTPIVIFPHLDKIVHLGLYFVMSGALWFEFLRNYRDRQKPMHHAWIGAFLAPVLFSGIIELLQEYCTTSRGGDWIDLTANIIGALMASLLSHYIIAPRYFK
jgi:Predicted integral membrane protein